MMEMFGSVLSSVAATSHMWRWSTCNVASVAELWILFQFKLFGQGKVELWEEDFRVVCGVDLERDTHRKISLCPAGSK